MKQILYIVLFVLSAACTFGQQKAALQFVEYSSGLSIPEWESGMTELEFADIDRDGHVDILSIGDHGSPNINATEHGIMVWFGDPVQAWSVEMTGNFGYGGIAIGDVNNDGHWDVGYGMHHDYSSTDLGDQLLEVALGDGTGINWTPYDDGLATNGESWGLFGTDFADVDNDGDLDIGSNSFGSGSGLHVYINNGDGTWTQSYGIMEGNSNMRFVFGDINNDGNADFVVTHDAGIAFFGDGEGNFTNADYNLPQYSFPMSGPDLKDVDQDGGKDLAYVNPDGGVMVWRFDPSANQWEDISGDLPQTGDYQEAQLCDFNSDGMMDIAAFGNAVLTVWKGELGTDRIITWTQKFNTTTSDNGDCAAFRAGGDVDRNGRPDMVLVEKEGSWPNDQNHLKCYKENTPYFLPHIRSVYPGGNEKFVQGSVHFVDWLSAVPGSSESDVKLEYSLRGAEGPYQLMTEATSNSGRYQWILPMTVSTNNCFIRYTLVEGEDTLTSGTPEAFTILGDDGIDIDFKADTTSAYPGDEISFYDLSLGLLTEWEWDFDNNGSIDSYERNPVYAYDEPGKYTVKLKVSDGTNNEELVKYDYITINDYTFTTETSVPHSSLMILPNPASEYILVDISDIRDASSVELEMFNSKGILKKSKMFGDVNANNRWIKINISELEPGLYYCRVRNYIYCLSGRILIQ